MTTIDSLQIGMHWFAERPGGLDRMFKAMIDSLPAQGVSVRGLVAGSPAVFENSGGVVQPFASPQERLHRRLWLARRHCARLKRARRPDVVATHFALYAAPTIGVFAGVPRVVHFQGPWAQETSVEGRGRLSRAVRHAVEWSVYRGASRLIVLSRAFGGVLHESYGVPEDRIRVVPGCVDVSLYDTPITKEAARTMLGISNSRRHLFCIRRLVSRMGLEDLIDAMFVVRQSVPDVMLTIAGKGPLESSLRERIKARGLEQHVNLAGFVPDDALPIWYRAAELTVVPTVSLEGFGLTTVESLASGTPVLVTPVGGLPEAVAPLSTDLVLPSGGFHALGSGIVDALLGYRLLPDDAACRAYARANFDYSVVASQVAKVYREAVERH